MLDGQDYRRGVLRARGERDDITWVCLVEGLLKVTSGRNRQEIACRGDQGRIDVRAGQFREGRLCLRDEPLREQRGDRYRRDEKKVPDREKANISEQLNDPPSHQTSVGEIS